LLRQKDNEIQQIKMKLNVMTNEFEKLISKIQTSNIDKDLLLRQKDNEIQQLNEKKLYEPNSNNIILKKNKYIIVKNNFYRNRLSMIFL